MSARLAESSASCECRWALRERSGSALSPSTVFFFSRRNEARGERERETGDGATYELSRLDRAAGRGHGLALRAARVHVHVPRRHFGAQISKRGSNLARDARKKQPTLELVVLVFFFFW